MCARWQLDATNMESALHGMRNVAVFSLPVCEWLCKVRSKKQIVAVSHILVKCKLKRNFTPPRIKFWFYFLLTFSDYTSTQQIQCCPAVTCRKLPHAGSAVIIFFVMSSENQLSCLGPNSQHPDDTVYSIQPPGMRDVAIPGGYGGDRGVISTQARKVEVLTVLQGKKRYASKKIFIAISERGKGKARCWRKEKDVRNTKKVSESLH